MQKIDLFPRFRFRENRVSRQIYQMYLDMATSGSHVRISKRCRIKIFYIFVSETNKFGDLSYVCTRSILN